MDIRLLETDPAAEREGKWFKYPVAPEVEICIARADNPDLRAFLQKQRSQVKQAVRDDNFDDEAIQEQGKRMLTDYIVKGWRGLDEAGAPIPFSTEKCRELVDREPLRDLWKWVLHVAREHTAYLRQGLEDDAKN